MDKIKCNMIVYTKSKERVENFNKTKEILKELEMFDAIDGINMYEHYKKYALSNNYVTQYFIDDCEGKRDNFPKLGIMGCLLSHLTLLKDFVENSDKEWLFVMEDDATLDNFHPKIFDYLIDNLTKQKSNFLQMFVNPRFIEKQLNEKKYNHGLYRMIHQWGLVSYMINKEGAKLVLSKMPYKQAIDMEVISNIDELNAIAFVNNIIKYRGALGSHDKNSELGSLLWNIKPN